MSSTKKEKNEVVTPSFKDFLLLVEWCQEKGPNIIRLFPYSLEKEYLKNLDFLSVFSNRIFSSDRDQIGSRGSISGLSSWNTFNDSSTYLTDMSVPYFSYVQRITLHDLKARGFVRPICLCYLTQHNEKIIKHFDKFISSFSIISKTLQFGNNVLFIQDIIKILKEIKTKKTVRREYEEIKERLEKEEGLFEEINTELERQRNCFGVYLEKSEEICFKEEVINCIKRRIFDGILKDEVDDKFEDLMNKGILQNSSDDFTDKMRGILAKVHKNTDFERLRPIEKISGTVFRQVELLWNKIYSHFKRDGAILDLEINDLDILRSTPLPSTLFIGNSLVLDFTLCNSIKKFISKIDKKYKKKLVTNSPAEWKKVETKEEQNQKIRLKRELMHENDLMFENIGGTYISSLFKKKIPKKEKSKSPKTPKNQTQKSSPKLKGKSIKLYGLLHMMGKYVFLKDIVFNILRGRIVIIYGKEENKSKIERIVKTLSLFLPGNQWKDNFILPFQEGDEDLDKFIIMKYKLVGLSKNNSIPKEISPYISLFDFEKEIFYGLEYESGILDLIFSKEKKWRKEESFIAYIHTLFLEYGIRASMYYHLVVLKYDLQKITSPLAGGLNFFDKKKGKKESLSTIMNNLDISSESDLQVCEYLCEVVKNQQSNAYQKVVEDRKKVNYTMGRNLIKLNFKDFEKLQKIENKKK